MIHIELNSDQILKIKDKWASWFFTGKRVSEFISVLEKDTVFSSFFFTDEMKITHREWKKQYDEDIHVIKDRDWQNPVVTYFFQDLSDSKYVVEKYAKELENLTKQFLLKEYKNYRSSKYLMQILDEIGIKVCPYCNRNFIDRYALSDKKGKINYYFKGDLDHYYSKNEVPALALSFYNLIPCCKVCNHEKHESKLRTFHPYYDYEDQEYCFAIELYSDEEKLDIIYEKPLDSGKDSYCDLTVWQGISDNFKIVLKNNQIGELGEAIQNSNTVFKLEKKYNHSKEYVKEIIRKNYIYPQIKKDELFENFPEIFQTKFELEETLFGFSSYTPSQKCDRPLAKLTKDILKQLKM